MTWFDLIALLVIVVSLLLGLFRGFVREVISLATWILAGWLAVHFAERVAPWMPQALPAGPVRVGAAFLAIFVVVLIVAGLLGALLAAVLRAAGLGPVDRIFGALFGILRGLVMLVLFVLVAGLTPAPRSAWWSQSLAIPPLEHLAGVMLAYLPASIGSKIHLRGASRQSA